MPPAAVVAVVFAFVLALEPPLAHGQSFDRLRASIRRQLEESKAPSVAVAVARGGEILFEEGFGWANREQRIAATARTPYSLASISKPITATGLMLLVERGKVDLDRPVNDYLGDALLAGRAGNAAQATVRRVANHTSGLPLHYQFFYEDEPYRPPPRQETIRRYGNLITPPGERYQYSNLGYGVLDHLITRVAGNHYADFMREQVFSPLALTETAIGVPAHLTRQQAIRYGGDSRPIPFYDFDHPGGSAVYASAHDLVRFAMFHLKARPAGQKQILTTDSIDAMQKPTVWQRKTSGYGIGWAVETTPAGYTVVSHGGGMGGVSTILRMIPAKKIAVVVLSNARSALPGRISAEILSTLVPDFAERPDEGRPQARLRPTAELVGTWKGSVITYAGELPLALVIHASGDVRARLGRQPETALNQPRIEDGYLTGRMNGELGTQDVDRRPYELAVSLRQRGGVLNGGMTALSSPGPRAGNALTHWVELYKLYQQ